MRNKTLFKFVVLVAFFLLFGYNITLGEEITQTEVFLKYEALYGPISLTWEVDQLNALAQELRSAKWEDGQKDGLSAIALYHYALVPVEELGTVNEIMRTIQEKYPELEDHYNYKAFYANWCTQGFVTTHIIMWNDTICVYADAHGDELLNGPDIFDEANNAMWYRLFVTDAFFVAEERMEAIWYRQDAPISFWEQIDNYYPGCPWEVKLAKTVSDYSEFHNIWPLQGKALERLVEDNITEFAILNDYFSYSSQYARLPDESCITVDCAIKIARETDGFTQQCLDEQLFPDVQFYETEDESYFRIGFYNANYELISNIMEIDAHTGMVCIINH